jgi:hypothetical protein
MTLQHCCAERNDLLQVAFDLGITDRTPESCRLQCWHNSKSSADDPRHGRPRASRTTALFTLNKECAKGVTFKSGLYDQLRKCHEDQLVPMCSACFQLCKPNIKIAVEQDPVRRDTIVQEICNGSLLDLGRLYKLLMQPVLLRVQHHLSHKNAMMLFYVQQAKQRAEDGHTRTAIGLLAKVEQMITGDNE